MASPSSVLSRELIAQITEAIRTIRFGSIQLVIHDSRVVQIEKSEKIRLTFEADRTDGGSHNTPGQTDRIVGGSPRVDGR